MKRQIWNHWCGLVSAAVLALGAAVASAQTVRIAPIVKQMPTAAVDTRLSGATPPASDARVDPGSTFYIELWATNVDVPLNGLACVYVDMTYGRTDLIDSVPPAQDSNLFTVNAVTPVFTDASGFVGDTGGCQPAPVVPSLGVGEWVMVERIQMSAIGIGGPINLTLVDANNLFAGTSIIGQLNNVDPADIEFLPGSFRIAECLTAAECDDGNPCTNDSCAADQCENTPDDGNNPDDGDFCNGVDTCVGGSVVPGTPPNCDDSNVCTDDSCDEVNDTCVNTNDDSNDPEDGLFCNGIEACSAGAIVPGTPPNCDDTNPCTDDSCDEVNDTCVNTNDDTNDPDDGLFCNGVATCSGGSIVPGSPPDCDDTNPCTDDACDEVSDTCQSVPNDGNDPSDGLFCNGLETCAGGNVLAGTPPNCDDTNVCTDDSCDEVNDTCVNTNDDTNDPDDGDFCNGVDTCSGGSIVPGSPPDCDDTNVCTDDSCDEVNDTCVNAPNDANDPEDGLFCNGIETCSSGSIVPGSPPNCDDTNFCTDDSCDEVNDTCVNTNDDTNDPDDGLFCNGVDTCVGGSIVTGSPPNCNDMNPCTTDSCNETIDSCVNNNNTLPCNDNNSCTSSDTCSGGVCMGTPIGGCDPCTISADCDDGNPCTDNQCIAPGVCIYPNNSASCDDGDLCTESDTCSGGSCAGSPVDCASASDECNVGVCNGTTGLCEPSPANEGGNCDNGDPCTVNDMCSSGVCSAGAPVDCSSLDDACNVGVCNGTTGLCEPLPANESDACDDGNPCTELDACSGGTCSGTPIVGCQTCTVATDCDDGDPCTDDMCHPAGICVTQNNMAPCDDGDPCTNNDTCGSGLCSGSSIPGCQNCTIDNDCDDANVCTDNTCVGGVCIFNNNTISCDDADPCTETDVCSGGTCSGSPISGCQNCTIAADCDDGNICTDEDCVGDVCQYTNNAVSCDDADPCTAGDVCAGGVCAGTSLPGCQNCTIDMDCDDFDPCTDDVCTGGVCGHSNNTASCDDGDLCTAGDVCFAGVCAGTSVDCSGVDDACNVGVCNGSTGLCEASPTNEGGSCDDGSLCTQSDMCSSGVCAGAALDCTSLNSPCTLGTCNESSGLCEATPRNEGGSCNDGNSCTSGDQCNSGICMGTLLPGCDPCTVNSDCDDGNPCTTDTCHAAGVCLFTDNNLPCDDGDACTENDTCSGGSCAGSALDCTSLDDGCNVGVCNVSTGACEPSPVNEGGNCDDGDLCTQTDTCSSGTCVGSNPIDCSAQSDDCNLGVCDPGTGLCGQSPTNNGGSCDDGNPCTDNDLCAAGACTGTMISGCQTCSIDNDCDDSDPCTNDMCHPAGLCVFNNNTAPCNDGNPCTENDACSSGTCAGSPVSGCQNCVFDTECDDGNLCTDDTCPSGACVFTNNAVSCDDGDPCTSGDACAAGGCSGTPISGCQNCTFDAECDDGDPCTDDTCPAGVCVLTFNTAPCDDGFLCTQNDMCTSGVCTGTVIPGCQKCTFDIDCDDLDPCTDDTCTSGVCSNTQNTSTCNDGDPCTENDVCSAGVCAGTLVQGCQTCINETDCDDGDPCTTDVCLSNTCAFIDETPPGRCCNPTTGLTTLITDDNACTVDTCNADGSVSHVNNTPLDECCNPLTGLSVLIDDSDACTMDTCNFDGSVSHVDSTPSDQCCDPIAGGLTSINDLNACTFDICNADGTVSHSDTTPNGRCCSPVTGNLTVIDDGDACTVDTCNPNGSVTHVETTPPGQCCNPITGLQTPIDDGDACSADVCNANGSVTHTDTTPTGQCCSPVTGTLTPINDGDICTVDVCNADGSVNHTDSTPLGLCCDPFTGALRPINDGNQCTTDICNADGTVSHFNTTGPCDDGDICTSNDQCTGGVCRGVLADPLCTPTLDLVPNLAPFASGGGSCFGVDDLITIEIQMGASTPSIVGGQFFLKYDPSTLDFISMVTGDPPFSVEIIEVVNEVAGTINYAVAVPAGDTGTNVASTLAIVTFQAIAECDSYVQFRPNNPPTQLTDSQGFARNPILGGDAEFTINDSPPVFANCPLNVVRNADAGTFGAVVPWNPVVASDSCDGPVTVTCDEVPGELYPAGTTPVSCQATNSCGVTGFCDFDVIVRPFSEMLVSIQLSPTIATSPLTRCITFDLWQCGFVTESVAAEIEFFNGLALEVPIQVPAGFYECVTARDALHTLRTTASDFSDDGRNFSATFVGNIQFGGHGLTGGDLNDDDYIDIVDFAIYNANIGLSTADTDCSVQAPHADINADGVVNAFDFTFIQQNFLRESQPNCCGTSGASEFGDGPMESITIEELRDRGLGYLSGADLNNDGVIDVEDIRLSLSQDPEPSSRKRARDYRSLDDNTDKPGRR